MFEQSHSQFPALFDVYNDDYSNGKQQQQQQQQQQQPHHYYSLDFSSFHSPADLAAPSIDCFESELDQLDLLELEVTQVNNAFSQVIPTIGPPSSFTQSSESSTLDTLSFYSEPFNSPSTSYSFSFDDMDFQRIRVDDFNPAQSPLAVLDPASADPTSFGPLPPTPPRSPPAKSSFDKPYISRSSFSDYGHSKRNNSISSDFYSQLGFNPQTISPSHISNPIPIPSTPSLTTQDQRGDSRKKYKCSACPRAFARAYNLKTHMATHDPNRLKPHVCPHPSCGRSFSRKHDLGRHLISIHRAENDREPTTQHAKVSIGVGKGHRGWCESCGKGYVGKSGTCECHDVK